MQARRLVFVHQVHQGIGLLVDPKLEKQRRNMQGAYSIRMVHTMQSKRKSQCKLRSSEQLILNGLFGKLEQHHLLGQ